MKINLTIAFLILTKFTFGQTCLDQLDSIFRRCDTTNFEKVALNLSESCKKSSSYLYYSGLSYFFQNNTTELDKITSELIVQLPSENFVLKIKARLFCFLLIEEYRRIKNKYKFEIWVGIYYEIREDSKCGTPYMERVDKTLHLMLVKYKKLNDTENINYYEKVIQRNRRSNRIKNNFLRY